MKQFKIGASAIGKIMAGEMGLTEKQSQTLDAYLERQKSEDPKKKLTPNMEAELASLIEKRDNPQLPQGAKSYCEEWYLKQATGRKKEWFIKYVEKGLAVEPIGIKMLSDKNGCFPELEKNEDWFENDFLVGSPDVIQMLEQGDTVSDIKCSWDVYSFPWFATEIENQIYWWQLQGYMELLGLKHASLVYCLIDTPKPLIQQELKKLYFQTGGRAEDWTPETYKELEANYKFDDIDPEKRIKEFPIAYDAEAVSRIKPRVEACREYIKTLDSKYNRTQIPA